MANTEPAARAAAGDSPVPYPAAVTVSRTVAILIDVIVGDSVERVRAH